MIKLSAHVAKKLPMPGVAFSSQTFGASLEIEISDADADRPEALRQRTRNLYALLSRSIDEEIAAAGEPARSDRSLPARQDWPRREAQREPSRREPEVREPEVREPARREPDGRDRVSRDANNREPGGPDRGSTPAQQRAIHAICRSQGLAVRDVLSEYGTDSPRGLTVKEAGAVIDRLKAGDGRR